MLLQVDSLLHDLDDGMRPISVFFPYLPTSYHKKRDLARIELGKIFAKVGDSFLLVPTNGQLVHLFTQAKCFYKCHAQHACQLEHESK